MSTRLGLPGRRSQAPGAGENAASRPQLGARKSWLLAVCCVAQFMVILDLSIVNVALPSIQVSLGFTAIQLQWVVDAYSILFAGFLMLGGRATDYFGQRRTFVAALLFFALASLAGGSAVDKQMLIVARGAQGFAGALMAASSLAIITSSFEAGPERHRAIGLWGAMNGAGGAAGTFFGGFLTQEAGWRWVLLINPPIGVAAAVVAAVVVAGARRTDARPRFDLAGALTLTAGLIILVYGIVTAGYLGLGTPASLVPLLVGVGMLAAFPVIEIRYAAAPLVPLRDLTGPLRTANVVVVLFSAGLLAMWYVSSLYLQQVLALSPLDTGLVFLPMALVIMVSAQQAAGLVNRFGIRTVLGSGLLVMTSGMLLMTRIGPGGSAIGYVMVPGLLMATGIGLSVVTSTIAATQVAGPAQAGLASGLVNTSRQVGGAIGIAVLVAVASQRTSHLIGANHPVPQALTDGFRLAYFIGAAFIASALAVAVFALQRLPAAQAGPRRRRVLLPGVAGAVAVVFLGVNLAATTSNGTPIGAYTTRGSYTYVSAPGLHPPRITADRRASGGRLAPGYFLLANFYDVTAGPMDGQSGPLVLGNDLQPVWFRPVPTDQVASNLEQETYDGEPVLTWWQGDVTPTGAINSGEYVVVNDHYRTVATLHGRDGWVPTLHEARIVGHDIWVTANKNIPMDLSKYGGPVDGALIDSAVQEYDLRTGKLLYTWNALDHIPLSESYSPPPTNGFPWDAYHVNSFSLRNGTLVTSMRNTWAAYDVDLATGKIRWTLGGKRSSFTIPDRARFEWQHDVKVQSPTEITLFDDACCEITGAGTYLAPNGRSRGEVLHLDLARRTASLVRQYVAPLDHGASAYMGDLQPLADGNQVVGWGSRPYFSEYTKGGKVLLDAKLPGPDLSYRVVHTPKWTGLPLTRPRGAARRRGGSTTVYASWNGATRVAAWRVQAGTAASGLRTVVARSARTGFETSIGVPAGPTSAATTFRVQALDASGRVIGASKTFRVAG